MRLRTPMLAAAVTATACAAAPALASAAPRADHDLTIHATPSHIVAGDPVLIFGHLSGPGSADRRVVLWHRVGTNPKFTVVSVTKTNAQGRYFFPRAQHIVNTNRSWFVRGPGDSHSMTIHESVAAELTIAPTTTSGTTRHPIDFTGQVTPGVTGGHVDLQVQTAAGNSWRTIATGKVGAGGTFSVKQAWRTPGPRTVRAYFPGNRVNTPAASDPTAVVVQQREAPYFTIATSDPVLADGATATISGHVKQTHTSAGAAGVTVGLYARTPGATTPFALAQQTTTGSGGAYSFTVGGTTNELYQARVMGAEAGHSAGQSAVLFQGIQDDVTMTPSATTSTVGGQVTFAGSVAPDSAGHVVFLEYLGHDGHWQVAATSTVAPDSTYSIPWTFGTPGAKQFRVHVAGGPDNVGGASAPTTITVAQPTVSSLPGN